MVFNKTRNYFSKHNINHTPSSFVSLPAYARDCGCLFGLKSRWITTKLVQGFHIACAISIKQHQSDTNAIS